MAITAGDGVDLLLASGIPVEVKTFTDATVAKRHARLVVRQTPPSPSMIAGDPDAVVVYVVPRLTESLRRIAEQNHRIAVVATGDGVVIWEGERREPVGRPEPAAPTARRKPWARFGLIRALARTQRPRRQAELAAETGATQASVSQNLNHLEGFVTRSSGGWALRDVRQAAEYFLAEYPGAQGITQHWFGLGAANQQAERVARLDGELLVSGDVGADHLAPWRTPRSAVIYARTGLDLAPLGFAESQRDRATLAVTVPADPTIWPVSRAYAGSGWGLPVVDPLLCAYDVERSGGSDAAEAREHLLAHLGYRWRSGND